jgi:hypothetical protein
MKLSCKLYTLPSAGDLIPYSELEVRLCHGSVLAWKLTHEARETRPVPANPKLSHAVERRLETLDAVVITPLSGLSYLIQERLGARNPIEDSEAREAWVNPNIPPVNNAPLSFTPAVIWYDSAGARDPGDEDEDIPF